jgi:hypothetical protein
MASQRRQQQRLQVIGAFLLTELMQQKKVKEKLKQLRLHRYKNQRIQ